MLSLGCPYFIVYSIELQSIKTYLLKIVWFLLFQPNCFMTFKINNIFIAIIGSLSHVGEKSIMKMISEFYIYIIILH